MKMQISIMLDEKILKKVDLLARKNNRSRSYIINKMLK